MTRTATKSQTATLGKQHQSHNKRAPHKPPAEPQNKTTSHQPRQERMDCWGEDDRGLKNNRQISGSLIDSHKTASAR